jgi:Secretion system C-terminal sorting domain
MNSVPIKMIFTILIICSILAFVNIQECHSQGFATDDLPAWFSISPEIDLNDPLLSLDDSHYNYEGLPPIGYQGTQNSSTTWACAYYYLTYLQWQEFGWDVTDPSHQMSPAFSYNLLNAGINDGASLYNAFLLLEEIGCATMADMPFYTPDFLSFPSEDAFRNASQFRILEPMVINFTTDQGENDLKNHLLNGNIAVITFNAYSNFRIIQEFNNIYCASDINDRPVPYTAVCIGFDDNLETNDGIGAWRMVNSDGVLWGDNGYWWMSYECGRLGTITNPNAFYATDRIDYQPSFVARVEINHTDRYRLKFGMLFHDNDEYKEYFTFNQLTSTNIENIPFDPNVFILDLTDMSGDISSEDENLFTFSVFDLDGSDGNSGELVSISIEDLQTGFEIESSDTPIEILDTFQAAQADINLYYPAVAPENFVVEIDHSNGTVQMSWSVVEINENFVGYEIFKNDLLIGNITENSFQDTLNEYGIYRYSVRSIWLPTTSSFTEAQLVYWLEPVSPSNLHVQSIEANGDCRLRWDQTRSVGLVHDDGSAEDYLLFNENTPPGAKIAQTFTSEGSGKVEGIGVYIDSDDDVENGLIQLAIFSNSPDNNPGSQLWISEQFVPDSSDYWFWLDLGIDRVWLSDNQIFWVAYVWEENGETPLGIDSNGLSSGNYLGCVNGQNWFSMGSSNPMIHVEYGVDEYVDGIEGLEGFNVYKNGDLVETVTSDDHYAFTTLETAGDYTFRVDAEYPHGIITGEDFEFYWDGNAADVTDNNLPNSWRIEKPYPNPFNPSTMLTVKMADAAELNVEVFNILGQRVATLADGRYLKGVHRFQFNANGLTSGIYFIRTEVPGKIRSIQKVTFMK